MLLGEHRCSFVSGRHPRSTREELVHIQAHMCVYTHEYTCTDTHARAHTCMDSDIHTSALTHIHMHSLINMYTCI